MACHGLSVCGMDQWVWHSLSRCSISSLGVSKDSMSVSMAQSVCLAVTCHQWVWHVLSGCGMALVHVSMALVGVA